MAEMKKTMYNMIRYAPNSRRDWNPKISMMTIVETNDWQSVAYIRPIFTL